MAKVKAVVYEQFKQADGTYHVKVKVYQKGERRFIDTPHFVGPRQLDAKLNIKDKIVTNLLDTVLTDYRRTIGDLGPKLRFMTCDDLKVYLEHKDEEIDFVKFCDHHIAALFKEGRVGTAKNHAKIRNSLVDYLQRKSFSIMEINGAMLYHYEKWLRAARTMTRSNHLGKQVTTTEQGMTDGGVYSHMRDLRTLFNEARRLYNNEDLGIIKIKHYPFKVYKVGKAPRTRKRNIQPEQIIAIRDAALPAESRMELARDLFMLSFYLCGINAVDLYHSEYYDPKWERLDYNRSKTRGLRSDDAFMSIKIVDEARPLMLKYLGKLKSRYTQHTGLDTAINKGMVQLREELKIPDITYYWARHSFASIARNKCRISKDDIAEALNHVDSEHRITDIYIEKDWSIVDDVQRAVLATIRPQQPEPGAIDRTTIGLPDDHDQRRRTMRLVSA